VACKQLTMCTVRSILAVCWLQGTALRRWPSRGIEQRDCDVIRPTANRERRSAAINSSVSSELSTVSRTCHRPNEPSTPPPSASPKHRCSFIMPPPPTCMGDIKRSWFSFNFIHIQQQAQSPCSIIQ